MAPFCQQRIACRSCKSFGPWKEAGRWGLSIFLDRFRENHSRRWKIMMEEDHDEHFRRRGAIAAYKN